MGKCILLIGYLSGCVVDCVEATLTMWWRRITGKESRLLSFGLVSIGFVLIFTQKAISISFILTKQEYNLFSSGAWINLYFLCLTRCISNHYSTHTGYVNIMCIVHLKINYNDMMCQLSSHQVQICTAI